MFHLKPKDELTFGNPTSDNYMYLTDELLITDNGLVMTQGVKVAGTSSNASGWKQKGAELGSGEREELRKKAMHRDIERKRRQEMSQLYDNLRSLIPREMLKGKRSISDLMNEAMSYTKQLEKSVQESRNKRDRLRGLLPSLPKIGSFVTVQLEQDGTIEILINTSSSEFGLSRVMKELVANELHVVNSVSTKADDHRFLHKILAQAYDTRLVDISVLQERLTEVVNISLV